MCATFSMAASPLLEEASPVPMCLAQRGVPAPATASPSFGDLLTLSSWVWGHWPLCPLS